MNGIGGGAANSDAKGGPGGYFQGGFGPAGVAGQGGEGIVTFGGDGPGGIGGTGIFSLPGENGEYAGVFAGDVEVTGSVVESAASLKIDHPLDPENKYVSHSFVESPDMMNIYNGNVITDGSGTAIVTLPDWFEALNSDFRYQLTVIGQFAQAIIGSKIANRSFTIRTNKPNVEVSWMVTGIRQDPYAKAHPLVVEEDKPASERGLYLHPELFGHAGEPSVTEVAHQISRPHPLPRR